MLDRSKAGVPHHLRAGYNKKRDAPIVREWLRARYFFMFGSMVCETCGSTKGPLFNKEIGTGLKPLWFKFCSESCSKGSQEAYDKRCRTSREKYGKDNVAQSKHFRRKMKAYWDQFDETQRKERNAKRNKTLAEKFGSVRASIDYRSAKAIATNKIRYGGRSPTCSPEVRAKVEATNLRVRGVTNPSKDPEVMHKIMTSWKNRKSISLGAGVTLDGLQGYEPQVAQWLVSRGVKPTKVGRPSFAISYTYKGRIHTYHPDFLVRERKRYCLIEVKSMYTAALHRDSVSTDGHCNYQKVRAKINACSDQGYSVRLAIWHPKAGCFLWKGRLPSDRKIVRDAFNRWLQSQP